MPFWPPDVFAVMATLIERSSAYRHVIGPEFADEATPFDDRLRILDRDWQKAMEARAKAWSWGLMSFPAEAREGPAWTATLAALKESFPNRLTSPRPSSAYLAWDELIAVDLSPLQEDWLALVTTFADEPLIRDRTAKDASWWAPAMRLLVTADTASTGIGFRPRSPTDPASATADGGTRYPTWVQLTVHATIASKGTADDTGGGSRDLPFITTVTSELFDSSAGSVLPKTRTSPMGCTLRSLTHHLALLPPSGTVEARWRVPGRRPPPIGDRTSGRFVPRPLNLVLVPFPYRVSPKSFGKIGHCPGDKWGYFHLDQSWLRKDGLPNDAADPKNLKKKSRRELSSFVQSIVDSAADELGEVHGVLFPELALDWDSFEEISTDLLAHAGNPFEFIVAGLSEMPPDEPRGSKGKGTPCNYAAFRGRIPQNDVSDPDRSTGAPPEWDIRGGREKHHRWKLNQSQIERYGLASRLPHDSNWWEGIPVSRRVVEFFEIRDGSSMTVLICEDLARADPCQTVVRAIGPNLVIALLMDGPQRVFRWPAHYAGVLADDPGSTVLTLTSFGLIDRGLVTDETRSRSIALFKDCKSGARELQLPSGCHALAIRLEAEAKTEHTLDGRGDNAAAYIWRLRQVCPVRGRGESWITGE
jgi:hypothetical protein